jgi:hypothetical protein
MEYIPVSARSQLTGPHELRGVAGMDLHIWNTLGRHATCRYNGASANFNSWAKDSFCADPGAPSANDGPAKQAHVDGRPVMIPRAKICTLRNAAMSLYPYVRQIVNPQILTQPGMVANLEIPGEFDSETRL